MKKLILWQVLATVSAAVVVIGAWLALEIAAYFGNVVLPWHRQSAIRAACEMACVAPLQQSARHVKIQTRGSMFTREFILEFEAPAADISEWLAKSPDTAKLQPAAQPDGSLRYEYQPSGGAEFAEIILSNDGKKVRLRAF